MKETDLDDVTLLNHLSRDVNCSFEQLVLAYQDRLYGFALRLCLSKEDAQEIAQDAFVNAYRALSSYDRRRIKSLALRSWLYQITLNVSRNRNRRRLLDSDSLNGDLPAEPREQPEAIFDSLEQVAALRDALACLPDRYRLPVVLRHVEALTYREAADVLDEPIGTIKSNVHRGIGLLRAELTKKQEGALIS